jgi:hypothetical protein
MFLNYLYHFLVKFILILPLLFLVTFLYYVVPYIIPITFSFNIILLIFLKKSVFSNKEQQLFFLF